MPKKLTRSAPPTGTCSHVHVVHVDLMYAVISEPPLDLAAWHCMGKAEEWWGEEEIHTWSCCDGPEFITGPCCLVTEITRRTPCEWTDDYPAIFDEVS